MRWDCFCVRRFSVSKLIKSDNWLADVTSDITGLQHLPASNFQLRNLDLFCSRPTQTGRFLSKFNTVVLPQKLSIFLISFFKIFSPWLKIWSNSLLLQIMILRHFIDGLLSLDRLLLFCDKKVMRSMQFFVSNNRKVIVL